jgi:hypothetical protein
MTLHWRDVLINRAVLDELYTDIPALDRVWVRSVHLNRVGPEVIVRCDLGEFPDRLAAPEAGLGADSEAAGGGHHRLQLHLRFLDVADFELVRCSLPSGAAITVRELEHRRLAVELVGESVEVRFTSSDALTVGHLSTYRGDDSELDVGAHEFLGAVDRRLYASVPGPTTRVFHERV